MISVKVNRADRTDLYQQVAAEIRRAIADGEAKPGVKELLGHSSTRVTETYLHSSRTRTRAAVDALQTYRRENRHFDEP